MSNYKSITGKVAAILNEREVALNIGSTEGVEIGMRFKILANEPFQVRDPDSGDVLGSVDREKLRVKVVDVQERLTVCRTYRALPSRQLSRYSTGYVDTWLAEMSRPAMEAFIGAPRADHGRPEPLSEQESYVKMGDRAVRLDRDEEEADRKQERKDDLTSS